MVLRTLIFILLFSSLSYAQTRIKGTVVDENNGPLQGCSVTVTRVNNSVILAYAISDSQGLFELQLDSKYTEIQLNTSYIGFQKQSKTLANTSQSVHFILKESSEKLKEVIVKNKPIRQQGDTLNYAVSLFKNKQDRVIADVLKKLPGISVLSDGKILYQGTPIEKYYIEGMDLLEGKYHLANANLPANAVSKVQILENHQPIRLLDSVSFSNNTSLNIKLKRAIAVTGTAKTGVGIHPTLWEFNATPMLFSKNKQMISSYQTNNTGNDIATQIKTLTIDALLEEFDDAKKQWVNIHQLSPPNFEKTKWLNNKAHLVSTNYLQRLKKDSDLKINLSYSKDQQVYQGTSNTTYLTNANAIRTTEKTYNSLNFETFKGKVIYTNNSKNSYFKNVSAFKKYWDTQQGTLVFNGTPSQQQAKIPELAISNRLKWIQPIGKQLLNIKSIIHYSSSPQELVFDQVQFEDVLNSGNTYDKLRQTVNYRRFYTRNTVGMTKKFNNFSFTPEVGVTLQQQKLQSAIFLSELGKTKQLTGNFINELQHQELQLFANIASQYQQDRWKIQLETPFRLYKIDREDPHLFKQEQLNRFTFQPRISVKRTLNKYWKTTLVAGIKNSFGELDQLHYGYLLRNYRNIQRYDTPLLQRLHQNSSLGIAYRNPLNSLFINGVYTYTHTLQNLLLGNQINNNGSIALNYKQQQNTANSHSLSIHASKYVSRLKTLASLTVDGGFFSNKQLLNSSMITVRNQNIQFETNINSELNDWLHLNYRNSFNFLKAFIGNQPALATIVTQKHAVNIDFHPLKNQYIGLKSSYYHNNYSAKNNATYFLNAHYRYTFSKSGIDLEIQCTNILNSEAFTTAQNDTYFYSESNFQLRPRQIIALVKFSF
ncbi:conserved exported hypothetical protein [Tenacibaculum litopenaei]|uniref:carboxypeptidase-like regulatory domain-containing protein n=1 Tax=Tenacibaculum litopenaei TaxID=396016 RepID=UPI0038949798